jgi:hypothetical protein
MRWSWAMPRAARRSVFTIIAESAAFTCRVSSSTAWQDVSKRLLERLDVHVERVNWFSTYHVHHRVAGRFRQGRAFCSAMRLTSTVPWAGRA